MKPGEWSVARALSDVEHALARANDPDVRGALTTARDNLRWVIDCGRR